MHICLDLMKTFMKIGLFTFGGGYAMLGVIEENCAEEKKWITHDEMMDITVIAESTPGPVAINCATFVGYKQAGIKGAAAATFGVAFPSFVIIYLIAMFLERFMDIAIIANAFRGIRLAVGFLILNAAIRMIRKMGKDPLSVTLMVAAFAAMTAINVFNLKISTIVLMLAAAAVGLAMLFFRRAQGKKGGEAQ